MRVFSKVSVIAFLCLFFAANCSSPETSEWERLNEKATSLYEQGQYEEAVKFAKEALKIAEETFGPDHPDVAYSLNNLGELYRTQGKYAEAEPLHKRALAIWEEVLGKDHLDVATSLNNLALLYNTQGKYAEAEPLYQESTGNSRESSWERPPRCGGIPEQSGGTLLFPGQVCGG